MHRELTLDQERPFAIKAEAPVPLGEVTVKVVSPYLSHNPYNAGSNRELQLGGIR